MYNPKYFIYRTTFVNGDSITFDLRKVTSREAWIKSKRYAVEHNTEIFLVTRENG